MGDQPTGGLEPDLYEGPTVLAPAGAPLGDRLARVLLYPLLFLLVVLVLLFYVFFDTGHIEGDSMYPTLHEGDRMLNTKSYGEPHAGDIVIFPLSEGDAPPEDLVKRVVALPGQTIEIRQGIAIVDGAVESTAGLVTSPYDNSYLAPYVVPQGSVYVLGDNRPVALDSRDFGPVPLDIVHKRAVFIFLPLSRFGPVPSAS